MILSVGATQQRWAQGAESAGEIEAVAKHCVHIQHARRPNIGSADVLARGGNAQCASALARWEALRLGARGGPSLPAKQRAGPAVSLARAGWAGALHWSKRLAGSPWVSGGGGAGGLGPGDEPEAVMACAAEGP
jgi:hypothetical protein